MNKIYLPKKVRQQTAGPFLYLISILTLIIFHYSVFSAWAFGIIALLVNTVIIYPVISTVYSRLDIAFYKQIGVLTEAVILSLYSFPLRFGIFVVLIHIPPSVIIIVILYPSPYKVSAYIAFGYMKPRIVSACNPSDSL